MRSLVLIISLLFAFASTQGQGAMFLRGSQPAPQPGAGILDSYPGAAFAAAPDVLIYSNHSVTDNTVGSQTEGQTGQYTVLVRRDNDDALRSFTYTEVSDGTLTTWVGPANNGFVRILYDQSNSGNHATQTNAANQPKIVDAGSLVVENGKAAIFLDRPTSVQGRNLILPVYHTASEAAISIFNVSKLTAVGSSTQYLIGGSATDEGFEILYSIIERTRTATIRSGGVSVSDGALVDGLQVLQYNRANRSTLDVYVNGSLSSTTADNNSDFVVPPNYLIGNMPSSVVRANINCQMIVCYNSNEDSNRTAIETAINNEYNIY